MFINKKAAADLEFILEGYLVINTIEDKQEEKELRDFLEMLKVASTYAASPLHIEYRTK